MYRKYLFCYFTGNEPEKESVHFALSEDGYHFRPLNGNQPFLFNQLGTGGVRDPFVFRACDGSFFIIGTDMRSEKGWNSNHAICVWHSADLIRWQQYPLIDMKDHSLVDSVRTWAPQALYDREKEMYMLYWANCEYHPQNDCWTPTVMWYAYTKDFRSLETEPAILYAPPCGKDAIDADIIEKDGVYYMFYKDENEKYICYVYSDRLTGPYQEPEKKNITLFSEHTEGCCVYPVGKEWVMIMDSYTKGRYLMQKSADLVHYVKVDDQDYDLNFSPRHGSVMLISDEEYDRLEKHFA